MSLPKNQLPVPEIERLRADALHELAELVRIPNNVDDPKAIANNARALIGMLERRGLTTRILETESGRPAVFGELPGPRTGPTLLVYCHYDGVPSGLGWHSDPYQPVLRAAAQQSEELGPIVPWPNDRRFDSSWRMYGRSVADSKNGIVAVLAALDLLRARSEGPAVELKILLDGEEERESPGLPALLDRHSELLRADAVVSASGEVHPSGQPTVVCGVRGLLLLEITTVTATSPAHSGHFGNFVPNAGLEMARLLASLKGADGRVAIDGFYDDVVALGDAGRAALAATPRVDRPLRELFALFEPEISEVPWHVLLSWPTLNVRGVSAGAVGEAAANIVPSRATAELDIRLVAGMDPDLAQSRFERHLRAAGATVVHHEPTPDELQRRPKIVRVRRLAAFPAIRTPLDHRMVGEITSAVRNAVDAAVIVEPTEGGSLPLYLFRKVAPVILALPTSNHDNRQHTADENLRLGHFFRAIEIWASVLRWHQGNP